jgi:hypothetical protein
MSSCHRRGQPRLRPFQRYSTTVASSDRFPAWVVEYGMGNRRRSASGGVCRPLSPDVVGQPVVPARTRPARIAGLDQTVV